MAEEKRKEYIKIYLTDFEKEKIKRRADGESMSISTFGRRRLLEKDKE